MEEIKAKTKEELMQKLSDFYAEQVERLINIALCECPRRRRWYIDTNNGILKQLILASCGIQVRIYQDEPGKVAVFRRGKFVDGVKCEFKPHVDGSCT